jgi:hypothetical protein
MAIYLGNLSIDQFEQRLKIQFAPEDKDALRQMRQEDVSVDLAPGKMHIFDIPFTVMCADKATLDGVLAILYKFDTSKFPTLQLGIQ